MPCVAAATADRNRTDRDNINLLTDAARWAPFEDDAQTRASRVRKWPKVRSGKGTHLLLKHPTTGKEVWVAVHTKKDAGRLGNRILREAGVE